MITGRLIFVFQVKNWVKELRKMLGNDISLCIAGNKIDLEKERHVPVEEAETCVHFINMIGLVWFNPL